MISIESLPVDENGIVRGVWRLLHQDPTFCGNIGLVEVYHGESRSPVWGRQLFLIATECGAQLYLEPWGEVPSWLGVPPDVAEVPAQLLDRLEACPWRVASGSFAEGEENGCDQQEDDATGVGGDDPGPGDVGETVDSLDVESLSREELIANLEARSVKIDRRWGEKKLREALLSALTEE